MNRHVLIFVIVFLLTVAIRLSGGHVYIGEEWNQFVYRTFYDDPQYEVYLQTNSFNMCMYGGMKDIDSFLTPQHAKNYCIRNTYSKSQLVDMLMSTGAKQLWKKQVWYHTCTHENIDAEIKSYITCMKEIPEFIDYIMK